MSRSHRLRTSLPTIRVSTRRVQLTLAVNDAPPPVGELMLASRDAVRIARAVIGNDVNECVLAIFLDARHRVTGYAEVVRGTLNAARLQPRDILVPACISNAGAIAIAHNHPSGDATPSRADRTVTRTLRDACALVGIPLLDHIIVTPDDFCSLREHERWETADEVPA